MDMHGFGSHPHRFFTFCSLEFSEVSSYSYTTALQPTASVNRVENN